MVCVLGGVTSRPHLTGDIQVGASEEQRLRQSPSWGSRSVFVIARSPCSQNRVRESRG